MICNNCGNEIEDGKKFCPRCGAAQQPVEQQPQQPVQQQPQQQQPQQPQQQTYTPPQTAGGGNPFNSFVSGLNSGAAGFGNKQLWLAVMASLAALAIMSVICGSIVVSANGQSVSVPFIYIAPLASFAKSMLFVQNSYGGDMTALSAINTATTAAVIYSIFAWITVVLFVISFIFTMKKKSVGILSGLAASAVLLILSIVMIIVSFSLGSQLGMPSGSGTSPSVWVWLSIPISLVYALFCFVKSKELLS